MFAHVRHIFARFAKPPESYGQPTVSIKQKNPTPERKRKGVGLDWKERYF
tara:strand:+ start:8052 stop:8201 length:150 start_codon:yes stop_codon:yes gene_type:complete